MRQSSKFWLLILMVLKCLEEEWISPKASKPTVAPSKSTIVWVASVAPVISWIASISSVSSIAPIASVPAIETWIVVMMMTESVSKVSMFVCLQVIGYYIIFYIFVIRHNWSDFLLYWNRINQTNTCDKKDLGKTMTVISFSIRIQNFVRLTINALEFIVVHLNTFLVRYSNNIHF